MLDLLKYVYGLFGLNYKLYLSSRPEGALGNLSMLDLSVMTEL